MINLISVHFLREVCHRPFSYQYFSRSDQPHKDALHRRQ